MIFLVVKIENTECFVLKWVVWWTLFNFENGKRKNIHLVMSDPLGNSFVFLSPDNEDEVVGNWFPEGPDIKCFVIFLDFHFNVLQ